MSLQFKPGKFLNQNLLHLVFDMNKFETKVTKFWLNHSYLVQEPYSTGASIDRITILEVTKTCYRIEWESGAKTYEKIERFDRKTIVEDLGKAAKPVDWKKFLDDIKKTRIAPGGGVQIIPHFHPLGHPVYPLVDPYWQIRMI